jgi:hypothetical protein
MLPGLRYGPSLYGLKIVVDVETKHLSQFVRHHSFGEIPRPGEPNELAFLSAGPTSTGYPGDVSQYSALEVFANEYCETGFKRGWHAMGFSFQAIDLGRTMLTTVCYLQEAEKPWIELLQEITRLWKWKRHKYMPREEPELRERARALYDSLGGAGEGNGAGKLASQTIPEWVPKGKGKKGEQKLKQWLEAYEVICQMREERMADGFHDYDFDGSYDPTPKLEDYRDRIWDQMEWGLRGTKTVGRIQKAGDEGWLQQRVASLGLTE